jgi:GT2 family glycosyltransferase
VTNATSNEAKIEVGYRRLAEMADWADRWCAEHRGQTADTKMLAFFCIAFSRRLWDEIGTLDERFGKGMFEDDDYCRRVLAAGHSLKIAFDSYVHHWQRASFIKLGEAEYFRTYYENQRRYRRKWDERHVASSEQAAKLRPILESARRSKGVLIFPPSVGWAIDLFQRPQHLARAAARDGYTVVYDCSTGPDQVDVASEI